MSSAGILPRRVGIGPQRLELQGGLIAISNSIIREGMGLALRFKLRKALT